MSTLFNTEQQQYRMANQDKEDILLVAQIPVALTALAVLFFLA